MKASVPAWLLLVAALCIQPARAQEPADYPSKPIHILVGFTPGGGPDITARYVAHKLGEAWKQQVIVDNRPAGAGVVAADITAKAPPDGYTIFMAYHQHTVNASLYDKLPFRPVDDFTPVTQVTSAGLILVVHPSAPVTNFREFMDWTRQYKGPLNFGSAGNGSGGHLAGELYKLMTGVRAQHIPYKGSGPSLIDLAAGQYQYNFVGMLAAQPFLKSGKLRAIAVTSPQRAPGMGNIPTVAESGLPGFEVVGWYGVLAPPRLPRPILDRLHGEIVRIIRLPEVRDRILSEGADPVGSTPEQFREFLLADVAKWSKVVKESGAKLD
jgi:tripartite-type tricarboxylate transporter receptor subunit TctC